MNERIKQLKKQATVPGYMLGASYVQSRLDEQKFAELIVQECIDTISDCSMEYCTRPQIVSEIKEHFGVKE